MSYIVGVDIGGTFTDCVVLDKKGNVTLGKALSTPEDFAAGALHALADAARNIGLSGEADLLNDTRLFFHACTVADNSLITRSGPKTGLLTTLGFGDTLLIMRGRTTEGLTESEAFRASGQSKPEPIIPRSLIEEVAERVDYKGSVLVRLEKEEIVRAVDALLGKGVESVAIALLWSLANDAHERALADYLKTRCPSIYLSLSSEVAPYLGEYERTATTAFNAYVGPRIAAYLRRLTELLRSKGLRRDPLVMQAYGGALDIDDTCRSAAGTIESGPAAGIIASRFLGETMGIENILTTDMGGTTFKVGVVRGGRVEKENKPVLMRYQLCLPKIWVESIGAGGGSIVWIDSETGLLKVGPHGAGSRPGPICYGLGGTEVTVSDADLILGYLNEECFLGGRMRLDRQRTLAAFEAKIAAPMKMTVPEAASGIFRITNAHMSDSIRRATVERGYDPREFTLFAFGGAAPVHAGRYAAELGIPEVVIPLTASVHSAAGLVSSDVVYEFGRSERLAVPAALSRVREQFALLTRKASESLKGAGFEGSDIAVARSLDMRYRQQVHELTIPLAPGTAEISEAELEEVYERFDRVYERTYGPGSGYREAGKEIMAFRVVATGRLPRPRLRKYPLRASRAGAALKGQRQAYFEEAGDFVSTKIYDYDRLSPGDEIEGPAVVETPLTTIVVNPRDRAMVDEYRNVRLFLGA
ncbi:MAG TPA: hydantoinase/oxoprolinase family protein [candidate division Zixibacteria bacterium]|nr:hydantoinase/oxoprolinase family protein [candidate division Zixibacteria bacterium]